MWQKIFTFDEFGGGGITVLFFQLVFRLEIFQNKVIFQWLFILNNTH